MELLTGSIGCSATGAALRELEETMFGLTMVVSIDDDLLVEVALVGADGVDGAATGNLELVFFTSVAGITGCLLLIEETGNFSDVFFSAVLPEALLPTGLVDGVGSAFFKGAEELGSF